MNHDITVPNARPSNLRCLMLACVAVAGAACSQEPSYQPVGVGQAFPPGTAVGSSPGAPSQMTAVAGAGASAIVPPVAPGMQAAVASPSDPTLPQLPPTTAFSSLPEACKGLQVLGMTNSPGGSVLPNKCAPFHGTYNNPYAIRCIDANPNYKTRWQGDEFCILPPPPDQGTQIHIAPKNFDDPAEVAAFELQPGGEINTYYYVNSDNTEQRYYYRTNYRMRGGSHHMIISVLGQDRADGWAGANELGTDLGIGGAGFGGAQRTDSDRPQGTLDVPPEDKGLGAQLAPQQQFSFNLHHMNHFDKPILREAWVNIWYQKEVTTVTRAATLFGNFADVSINPGEHRELHYSATVNGDVRIISYFGHRHVSTDRFGAWIERASGEKISAYESFNWEDMPVYSYDSVSQNPVADITNKVDGGHSGLLQLGTGDKVHFVCDVTNRQDKMLKFSNELYSGEMCILFGTGVGTGTFDRPVRVMD